MKTLLICGLWYLVFVFVTGLWDPILWGTTAKVLIVIILLIVLADADERNKIL